MTIENPLGFMEGWTALEPAPGKENQDTLERATQDKLDLDKQFARVFGTEEGLAVLEHLKAMTIGTETWCASLGLEKGTAHGFAREGQNSVIRYILERIEAAKGKDTTKGNK